MKILVLGGLAALLTLTSTLPLHAQESKSADSAKRLATAMTAAKADAVAAKDPSSPGAYVSALYIPGFQLLIVAGKYDSPASLDARLAKKEYRDAYMDLQGGLAAASKVFIEDYNADGLRVKRQENQAFDSADMMGKRTAFDSEWKKQNLSEDDYMKAFAAADARYAQMLEALLIQVK